MGRLYYVVRRSGAARALGNSLLALALFNGAVASSALAQNATNPGSCSGTNCLVIVRRSTTVLSHPTGLIAALWIDHGKEPFAGDVAPEIFSRDHPHVFAA